MLPWKPFGSAWSRWMQRPLIVGVDDGGAVSRWVCLQRQRRAGLVLIGAGQMPAETVQPHDRTQASLLSAPVFEGRKVTVALSTRAVLKRHVPWPVGLQEEDQATWAKALMAQEMRLSIADVVVDWGPEDPANREQGVFLAAVRASVLEQRASWAKQRGAALRILDDQSLALERVLRWSVQEQIDPVWLWWAGRDGGHVCTVWWYQGRWYDRQDVPVDLRHSSGMPKLLTHLVLWAQEHKPALSRKQWWWTGEALAPWFEQWSADPPLSCRGWVCQPAPMPFGQEIESLTQTPAHAWAVALGLALHPGWS